MSDFKREERYIVFKLKELTLDQTCDLRDYITEQGINTPECVVVESDWPNYEHVWQTIEQVANGTFDPDEITRLQADNEALQARVAWLVDALKQVMYCDEVEYLPENVQASVSKALEHQPEENPGHE